MSAFTGRGSHDLAEPLRRTLRLRVALPSRKIGYAAPEAPCLAAPKPERGNNVQFEQRAALGVYCKAFRALAARACTGLKIDNGTVAPRRTAVSDLPTRWLSRHVRLRLPGAWPLCGPQKGRQGYLLRWPSTDVRSTAASAYAQLFTRDCSYKA